MKKNYYLGLLILVSISAANFAQDVIVGGSMEAADESSWMTSTLNMNAGNTVEYIFGYTSDKPIAGTDGCLYMSGTNLGTADDPLTNFMFYQQVTLQRGVTYTFDGAYKDVRTSSFWTEVYVGGNEPAEGADYGSGEGAVLVSGFKSTNWEAQCPSDEFDGTFQADACTPGTTNEVFFEGTGDTTVYFGFRSGIWDDQNGGLSFEVFIDNISLTAGGGTNLKENKLMMDLYPNPFENELTISLDRKIQEVEVLNLLGQSVYKQKNINSNSYQLNLSGSATGIYYLIITDIKGEQSTAKTIKY
jgi:hypothetical protein